MTPPHICSTTIVDDIFNDTKCLREIQKFCSEKIVVIVVDKFFQKPFVNDFINIIDKSSTRGIHVIFVEAGEKNKNHITKEFIENNMIARGVNKNSCIIAIGGGVITDLCGFVAATYCRGIPISFLPTTLVGMVDASIGGKNGINTPTAKNYIGTFHFPQNIWISPKFLYTLPTKEIINGIVEIIKTTLVADLNTFLHIEKNIDNICDFNFLSSIIPTICKIKSEIVKKDPLDNNLRNILNFGHSIGHSIETVSKYNLSHGKAVSIGIICESFVSMINKSISKKDFDRIFLTMTKICPHDNSFDVYANIDDIIATTQLDKKNHHSISIVFLESLGRAKRSGNRYSLETDANIIKQSLHFFCKHSICQL